MSLNTEKPKTIWLGIDFSGNHRMWRSSERRSNIYVAEVHGAREALILQNLLTVQELPGHGDPFQRLVRRLKSADFEAAAIDAPFSIPSKYLPPGGHKALLKMVAEIQRPEAWPFPSAQDFACTVLAGRPILNKKPLRKTEAHWSRKVNVRSTLWCGPRGGAAMTVACLTLLQESQRPIWPWCQHAPGNHGILIEAFPAAQLYHWGIASQKYDGEQKEASDTREMLIDQMTGKIQLPRHLKDKMKQSADALDAVVCAFAAIAVSTDRVVPFLGSIKPDDEGHIAVHDTV